MASRFRTFVEAHGVEVRRLRNEHPYSNRKTVVVYNPDFQDRALKLASLLSVPATPAATAPGHCEIRLRLGRDFVRFDQIKLGRHVARAKS